MLRAEARAGGDLPAAPSVAGELWVEPDGTPTVVVGGGAVALLEVAPAGRARMSGADWARGARLEREERVS